MNGLMFERMDGWKKNQHLRCLASPPEHSCFSSWWRMLHQTAFLELIFSLLSAASLVRLQMGSRGGWGGRNVYVSFSKSPPLWVKLYFAWLTTPLIHHHLHQNLHQSTILLYGLNTHKNKQNTHRGQKKRWFITENRICGCVIHRHAYICTERGRWCF